VAALISDDVLDQFVVAGKPDECAERLASIIQDRPEASGIRIQAHPPFGATSSFDGYAETVGGMAAAIERINGAVGAMAR
jgi:hypothetical protein